MMKKTPLYTYIGLLSALFLMVSCSDADFLKEKPETFYTPDNIFSSPAQVDQVLTTCYIKVRNIYCPYNNFSELNLWSYSMGNGTDVFDVPTIRYGYRFNDYGILTPQHAVFYDTYAAFYYLINTSNLALHAIGKDNLHWESEEQKAQMTAQARFFRAFAYRNLAELFGGVPIVTEITASPRFDYQRASRLETYQYAIDELEAILADLPLTSPTAGRLVRAAAQHNLCQLYLDKGVVLKETGQDPAAAYQRAIQYGNDIIDGGLYGLMQERFGSRKNEHPDYYVANSMNEQTPDHLYSKKGYGIQGNVYWDLFQEGNQDYQQGNKEAIWVAQSDYEVYKTDGQLAALAYPSIYGPVFRDQGVYAVGALEDVGGIGMSQVTPTFYTRDLIYRDKWEHDLRNSEAVFRRIILGNVKGTEYYGKPVPWKVFYKEDKNGKMNDAAATLLYPISCKIAQDKFTGIADGEDRYRIFRDDYLIRLSETILLRAEAKWRAGDLAGAARDINLLRKRAQCSYLVQESDLSIDLILDERARELVYEESRWNTLLRMGGTVAADRIKRYSYWDYPRTTLNRNYNLWPIPQTVIDINKDAVLEQNPGW